MKYLFVWAALTVTALCVAGDKRTTQQDLVGAWRLVSIDVQGAAGREADPFYGNGSRGLLIYDASGWFSVQIEGAERPPVQVPSSRPVPVPAAQAPGATTAATTTAAAAAAAAASAVADSKALHSYYAYFGTWSFDPTTSIVTHHAKGALYPSEDAAVYPQHVEVTNRRMTFSRSQNGKTQTKVWERVSGPTPQP